MAISENAKKAERLEYLRLLLLDYPHGLTVNEVANRLHVNRSTIYRYGQDGTFERMGILYQNGFLKLTREGKRIHVSFTLDEAMSIHLATRLLATRMDRKNPHAAAALRRLSKAIQPTAAPISQMMNFSANVLDSDEQMSDTTFIDVLEVLTAAIARGRKTRIEHHSERTNSVKEYILSPYWIEPYAIGQSTHVIGVTGPDNKMRTLKLERIQHAVLLPDRYQIPDDFDPIDLLKDAWGIWFTEEEPLEVVLKFSPKIARRVKETRWHPSQTLEETEDGSLIWQAKIAAWREMQPWILGWGGMVEVLAPEALKDQIEALKQEG